MDDSGKPYGVPAWKSESDSVQVGGLDIWETTSAIPDFLCYLAVVFAFTDIASSSAK